ncbi:MAG: succinate dehydrogenase assembly factor 2 [Paracoccus sp. (in: a-proteobacteria)]|nr:succinate dehydrogenase assembly factor 2 [Paracoccus sp. (in: a-proteobacteria)]
MESAENRLRRLRMRSWRRGMKEMDLILGPFADSDLAGLNPAMLDAYEALLAENDQDLYLWITARTRGEAAGPVPLAAVMDLISAAAVARFSTKNQMITGAAQETAAD